MTKRLQGIIKSFNKTSGYGMIICKDLPFELPFQINDFRPQDLKNIKKGALIEFEIGVKDIYFKKESSHTFPGEDPIRYSHRPISKKQRKSVGRVPSHKKKQDLTGNSTTEPSPPDPSLPKK